MGKSKQPMYLIQDIKTGKKFLSPEKDARGFTKKGYKIIAKQGEEDFEKNKIKTNTSNGS